MNAAPGEMGAEDGAIDDMTQTEGEIMELNFTQDVDDVVAFNEYYIARDPKWRRYGISMGIVLPAVFLILGLAMLWLDGFVFTRHSIFAFILTLICAFLPTIRRKNTLRRVREQYLSSGNTIFMGEVTVTFSQGEIEYRKEGVREEVSIDKVHKVVITPGYFFIYISAISSFIIPRAKVTPEQVVRLQAYLQERIPQERIIIENR